MDRRFLQEVPPAASPVPLPPPLPLSAPAPYPQPYIQTLSADQAILYALVVTAVVLMALCLMVRALVLRMTGRLPYSRQLAAQQAAFQADQAWPGQPSFLPGMNPVSVFFIAPIHLFEMTACLAAGIQTPFYTAPSLSKVFF